MTRAAAGIDRVRALAVAFSLLVPGACRVSPPTAAELLAVGYRTPEQTFATFQTGIRAEEPDLQRSCFSARFLAENRLSKLNWREYIDVLREREPLLRYGLAKARVAGPVERSGERARLVARTHGRGIVFDLVLEEYFEVWSGPELVADGDLARERIGIQETADGGRWLYGQVPLGARPLAPAQVTELRLAREWKIEGIGLEDEPADDRKTATRPRE